MKKTDSNRTEYQEFLYSLFQKYEIEPNESWSNLEWKDIVDSRLANKKNLTNFYNELADYNIKNPSDQNWTHKINEKLEEEEVKTINKNNKEIDTHKTEYQDFLYSLFKKYGIDSPDESFAIEYSNLKLSKIKRRRSNIKITEAEDEEVLNKFLVRSGSGFDLHKYDKGSGIILGGYKIDCKYKIIATNFK